MWIYVERRIAVYKYNRRKINNKEKKNRNNLIVLEKNIYRKLKGRLRVFSGRPCQTSSADNSSTVVVREILLPKKLLLPSRILDHPARWHRPSGGNRQYSAQVPWRASRQGSFLLLFVPLRAMGGGHGQSEAGRSQGEAKWSGQRPLISGFRYFQLRLKVLC